MHEIGVVHGRFQVLHHDHMKYVLAARERCRHLVIGITNPDPTLTKEDPTNPERSRPEHNPFTYFERYTMVKAALSEAGISHRDFSVVPLPINFPELYRYYVPPAAVFFLTVYDDWGRRKLAWLRELGFKTEVLWERPPAEKGLTGTEVRRRLAEGLSWRELVPPAVAEVIQDLGLVERLAGSKDR
ncbi:MAG: nicotinate-nucleotide adenylyltransferase [Thermodesulfobacteriota bacterium]